jgi:hypothetical protein
MQEISFLSCKFTELIPPYSLGEQLGVVNMLVTWEDLLRMPHKVIEIQKYPLTAVM